MELKDFIQVPEAPTINFVIAGDASAIISFDAPSSDGGSPILSYTASCNPGPVTASGVSSPITSSAQGMVTNSASVESPSGFTDGNPGNNTASDGPDKVALFMNGFE